MSKLKQFRIRCGLSQTGLTIRSGIAQSTLSAIETGRLVAYPHQRERIAKALGVEVREIFDDEPATGSEAR